MPPDLPSDFREFLTATAGLDRPLAIHGVWTIRREPKLAAEFLDVPLNHWEPWGRARDAILVPPGPVKAVRLAMKDVGDHGLPIHLVWLPTIERYGLWHEAQAVLDVYDPSFTWTEWLTFPERWRMPRPTSYLRQRRETDGAGPSDFHALRRVCRRPLRHHVWACLMLPMIAAAVWFWISSPRPNLTVALYHQVQLGMTESEVKRLVGARPGRYSPNHGYVYFDLPTVHRLDEGVPMTGRRALWSDGGLALLIIELDDDNRVRWKHFWYVNYDKGPSTALVSWYERMADREIPDPLWSRDMLPWK